VGGGENSHEEERATKGRESLIKWKKSHDEELEKSTMKRKRAMRRGKSHMKEIESHEHSEQQEEKRVII
jgi:hypothetical protein